LSVSSCRIARLLASIATVVLSLPCAIAAHDIPSDVLVQVFVKPSGTHLQLLVRLPLDSLLNINLPKRGVDYLDLAYIEPSLRDAAKATADAIALYEDGVELTHPAIGDVRVALPSDKSFESYEQALVHVQGARLPVDAEVVWNQGFFDAALTYDVRSDRSAFAIHPRVGSLAPRVITELRFLPPNGAVRAFELKGDAGLVQLEPRWHQVALTFVKSGFVHILDGTDHLLFLFCLVIPLRRFRGLVSVVTAFTVAHSITLIASAYQIAPRGAWFPPVIDTLIAASIVVVALDNILTTDVRHRWVIAFGFGLAHGFAFSFALRPTLQLAGTHLLTSILSFNFGVELGQLFVLAMLVVVLVLFFQYAVAERMGIIVLSALVCDISWHRMIDRATILTAIAWPTSDLVEMARWATGAALAASAVVFLVGLGRHLLVTRRDQPLAIEPNPDKHAPGPQVSRQNSF
jgi:hypothetical protein